MLKITEEEINPFVRCVGRGTRIYQKELYCSYDYRLVYCVDGIGEVLCGEVLYPFETGDLFIFAPGMPFSVRGGWGQTCIVVNFDWTQNHTELHSPVLSVKADDYNEENVIEKVELDFFSQSSGVLRLKEFYEAEELLRQLHKVYFADVNPNSIWMSGLVKQLIGMLTERLRCTQQKNEKSFLLANRIVAYVREHYAQKITLEDVAAQFHYHPTYINRAMKTAVGVSFHQYLIDYRLRQSMQLLELKTLTMEEIALKTGFSNSKHFSVCFKKHFRISPSKYV